MIRNYCHSFSSIAMYVCICNAVTDRQIRQAIDSGATTLRDLQRELKVATGCGKCATAACRILREHEPQTFPEFELQAA